MSNNAVIAAILDRRSIRRYTAEPVPADLLEIILECGLQAPSARNLQPWIFTLVTDGDMIARINDAVRVRVGGGPDMNVLYKAPAILLLSAVKESRWSHIDCGIAAENMALAAHSLGLGACIIGMVRDAVGESVPLRAALGVPADYEPLIALTIGYPDEDPPAKPRAGKVVRV